jgi:acetyl esterase/lipase
VLAYPVVTTEKGVTHGGSMTNLLGKDPQPEDLDYFSNEKHVTKDTPPTFLFHTDEDKSVLPENAVRFYLALKKAKVPAELHIYEKGKHGVGLGTDKAWTGDGPHAAYCADWGNHLSAWVKAHGVLEKK